MKVKKIFGLLIFSLLLITLLKAQIPQTISYQGILTDTAGNSKPDGEYNFTFRFYETNIGGSAVWSETKKLTVKKGLFYTNLGDQSPFGNVIKFDKPYWLSIQIESETELSPRIALTSVGYSISSINSDTAKYAKQFKIINDQLVRSINGVKDDIILKGSGGTAVTESGDSIIITTSGGGSGGGVSAIQNTDNTLSITNPTGPTTTINFHSPFIINSDVGIGVNSPNAKLDVNGGSGNSANIGIHGSSNDNYGIYGTSNNSYGLFGESAGSNGVYARTYATGTYALLAGNGLGNKNYCGLASGSYSIFANGPAAFSTIGIGAEPDQNPNGIKLKINGAINIDGSSYFSGAMGIGQVTPAGKLDVNGGSGNGAIIGIHGFSNDNYGISGTSNTSTGVIGQSVSSSGVIGQSVSSTGVTGESQGFDGVFGISHSSTSAGISGHNNAGGYGIWGESPTGTAVWGGTRDGNTIGGLGYKISNNFSAGVYGGIFNNISDWAGYFDGSVFIAKDIDLAGNLNVIGDKHFMIDDPLDPANKYLIHSCIESPDRMNVYNGNVTTDANGSAIVFLPPYFEALNIDYRYQLTVIGQFAQAIVEREISNNQFTIKTDKPNVKVSWQVTGIRNDPYAKTNPMVVEKEKALNERGKYLKPELFGQPKEKGIYYAKPIEMAGTNRDKLINK